MFSHVTRRQQPHSSIKGWEIRLHLRSSHLCATAISTHYSTANGPIFSGGATCRLAWAEIIFGARRWSAMHLGVAPGRHGPLCIVWPEAAFFFQGARRGHTDTPVHCPCLHRHLNAAKQRKTWKATAKRKRMNRQMDVDLSNLQKTTRWEPVINV